MIKLQNCCQRWDANGDVPLASYDRDGEAARIYFDDAPNHGVRGHRRASESSRLRYRMNNSVEDLGRLRPYTPSLS